MSDSVNDNNATVEVCVYRSASHESTYAMVPAESDFDDLPDAFKDQFGEAIAFYTFTLHEDKVLAQADPRQVLKALSEQGFYLQLPPPKMPYAPFEE